MSEISTKVGEDTNVCANYLKNLISLGIDLYWTIIPLLRMGLWKQLLEGNAPIEFVSLGRWWGNNPIQKAQTEIDIMGEQDSESALFAECKWRNEKIDLDILKTLIGRSKLFHYTKVHYYLFSKSGFTKGCMDKAEEMGNVTLVSYADIIGAMRLQY